MTISGLRYFLLFLGGPPPRSRGPLPRAVTPCYFELPVARRLSSAVRRTGQCTAVVHVQLSRSDERASHPGPQDRGSSGGALIKDRLTEDQPSILFQVGSFAVNNPLLRKLTIWPPAPL